MSRGRLSLLFSGVLLAFLPCGCGHAGASSAAAAPDESSVTCEDRARAMALCLSALRQRCDKDESDCETTCQGTELNVTPTHPGAEETRQLEGTQCRDRCRHVQGECHGAATRRCPTTCS